VIIPLHVLGNSAAGKELVQLMADLSVRGPAIEGFCVKREQLQRALEAFEILFEDLLEERIILIAGCDKGEWS
jgi:hypothetical protein